MIPATATVETLTAHILRRMREVQSSLGATPEGADGPGTYFADALDSMGMAELLAVLARDCGTTPAGLEQCMGRQYGTVAAMAQGMARAGLSPTAWTEVAPMTTATYITSWLSATAVRLPDAVEPAATLNAALGRPAGWLEARAGIHSRRVWQQQDPLATAATAGQAALAQAGVLAEEVGTLLVTSEAPPQLAGLAAALHHRLDLRPETPCVDLNGACTGYLSALYLARALLPKAGTVLVLAVEAPSRYLRVERGAAGEAAALFGDAAAASVLSASPINPASVAAGEVVLGTDGAAGRLIRTELALDGKVDLHLDGIPLAVRAIQAMAQAVRDLCARHRLDVSGLRAVVAHGGNGRMPELLARQLGVPVERVWSISSTAGNLGTASLPAAWASRLPEKGPVAWTAVGAGLTWGAMLTQG